MKIKHRIAYSKKKKRSIGCWVSTGFVVIVMGILGGLAIPHGAKRLHFSAVETSWRREMGLPGTRLHRPPGGTQELLASFRRNT